MALKADFMLQEKGQIDYSRKIYADQYKAIAAKDGTAQSQGNQVHANP